MMATASMMFHRQHIQEIPKWMDEAPVGDLPLSLVLASKGKIGYIDDVMSVYRVQTLGSWSARTSSDWEKRKQHHYGILKMWADFDEWTHREYHHDVARKKFANRWRYFKAYLRNRLNRLVFRNTK